MNLNVKQSIKKDRLDRTSRGEMGKSGAVKSSGASPPGFDPQPQKKQPLLSLFRRITEFFRGLGRSSKPEQKALPEQTPSAPERASISTERPLSSRVSSSMMAAIGITYTPEQKIDQLAKQIEKFASTPNTTSQTIDSAADKWQSELLSIKSVPEELQNAISKDIADLKAISTLKKNIEMAKLAYSSTPTPENKTALSEGLDQLKLLQESFNAAANDPSGTSSTRLSQANATLLDSEIAHLDRFIKRDEAISTGLALLGSGKSITEFLKDPQNTLDQGDQEFLKNIASRMAKLSDRSSAGTPLPQLLAKADKYIKEFTSDTRGVRQMTTEEASHLFGTVISNKLQHDISTITPSSGPKGVENLKAKLQEVDTLQSQIAPYFKEGTNPIPTLTHTLTQKCIDAMGKNEFLSTLNSSRIAEEKIFLQSIDPSGSRSTGVVKNLDHLDHFATTFGGSPSSNFDTLSADNRNWILSMYQQGALTHDTGSDTISNEFVQLLGKMSQRDSVDKFNTFVGWIAHGEDRATNYDQLKLISASSPKKAVYEKLILKLEQASKDTGFTGGIVKIRHDLAMAKEGFKFAINNSSSGLHIESGSTLPFDSKFVVALDKAGFNIKDVKFIACAAIWMEHAVQTQESLVNTLPPTPVIDQWQSAGLITKDQGDQFKTPNSPELKKFCKVIGLGIPNEKALKIVSGRIAAFAEQIKTNTTVRNGLEDIVHDNISATPSAFSNKATAYLSEEQKKTGVLERGTRLVTNTKKTVSKLGSSAMQGLRGLRRHEDASVEKYTRKIIDARSELKQLQAGGAASPKEMKRLEGLITANEEKLKLQINPATGKTLKTEQLVIRQKLAEEIIKLTASESNDSKKTEKLNTLLSTPSQVDALRNRILQSASQTDEITHSDIEIDDLSAMISKAISDVETDGMSAIQGWKSEISLTAKAQELLANEIANTTFEHANTQMKTALSDENFTSGGQIKIELSKFMTANINSLVGGFVNADVDINGGISDALVVTKNASNQFTIDLSNTLSAGISFGTSLASLAHLTLGAEMGGTEGARFTFDSMESAAGFMAALNTGQATLALEHADHYMPIAATEVGVSANLTLGFSQSSLTSMDIGVGRDFTLSTEGNAFTGSSTRTDTYHYAVSGLKLTEDLQLNEGISSAMSVSYSKENGIISGHVREENITLDASKHPVAVGKAMINKLIDPLRLPPSAQHELARALGSLTEGGSIVITETMKPEQVDEYNAATTDVTRNKIRLNPSNFEVTIQILNKNELTSESSLEVGAVSVGESISVSKTSASATITVDNAFALRKTVKSYQEFAKDNLRTISDSSDVRRGSVTGRRSSIGGANEI